MTQRELPNFTHTSINVSFVVACLDFWYGSKKRLQE
jgi:hypothetical protein